MPFYASALVYAALTAMLLRGLLPRITTDLLSDLGDPLINVSILAWNAWHIPLTQAWWNFPAFAPLDGVTAFTEHFLLAIGEDKGWISDQCPGNGYTLLFAAG